MRRLLFSLTALAFIASAASCGTANAIQNHETEVAGYTLKCKKEIVEQKILNKKSKTVIVTP